eukprot:TRINITY_DN29466_c0_g1_i1.p1 TRINITY_DN29466_c0_g1~~TRINITY_DN29466_c0_g1_i1.p1  ORF type:complete len:879 (-),score=112.99 TRINITY_DN29466_c0_g1_i1:117-2753(-)
MVQDMQPARNDVITVPLSERLASVRAPGFDPHGWLKHPSLPPGIGAHTVLEVLNLFLEGIGAQLGFSGGYSPLASPQEAMQPPCSKGGCFGGEYASVSVAHDLRGRNTTVEIAEAPLPKQRSSSRSVVNSEARRLPQDHAQSIGSRCESDGRSKREESGAPNGASILEVASAWADAIEAPCVAETVSYPCGVSIRLLDFAGALCPVAVANELQRRQVLKELSPEHCPNFRRSLLRTLKGFDVGSIGELKWERGGIQDFVAATFQCRQLQPPNEDQLRPLFAKFDQSQRGILDARGCLCLADACFRAAFVKPPAELAIAEAEQWSSSLRTWPEATTAKVSYPGQGVVDLDELFAASSSLAGFYGSDSALSTAVIQRVMAVLEDGSSLRSALKVYRARDKELQGFFTWKDGQVLNFVGAAFLQLGLDKPAANLVQFILENMGGGGRERSSGSDIDQEGANVGDKCDAMRLTPCQCLSVFDVALRISLLKHFRHRRSSDTESVKTVIRTPTAADGTYPETRFPSARSEEANATRRPASLSRPPRLSNLSTPGVVTSGYARSLSPSRHSIRTDAPVMLSVDKAEAEEADRLRTQLADQDARIRSLRSRLEEQRQAAVVNPSITTSGDFRYREGHSVDVSSAKLSTTSPSRRQSVTYVGSVAPRSYSPVTVASQPTQLVTPSSVGSFHDMAPQFSETASICTEPSDLSSLPTTWLDPNHVFAASNTGFFKSPQVGLVQLASPLRHRDEEKWSAAARTATPPPSVQSVVVPTTRIFSEFSARGNMAPHARTPSPVRRVLGRTLSSGPASGRRFSLTPVGSDFASVPSSLVLAPSTGSSCSVAAETSLTPRWRTQIVTSGGTSSVVLPPGILSGSASNAGLAMSR